MGKQGKKKGGKKEPQKEESTSSHVSQQPSTSAQDEEEEEVGLTGAARKRKEKKELKEKAKQTLQALQSTRKTTTSVSEVPSEESSRAGSEAPSEAKPEPGPSKQATPPPDLKVEEIIEEFEGLGLPSTKKKKPKKKKPGEVTSPTEAPKAAPAQVPPTAAAQESSAAVVSCPPWSGPEPADLSSPLSWGPPPGKGRPRGRPVQLPSPQIPTTRTFPLSPSQSGASSVPSSALSPTSSSVSVSGSERRPPRSLEPVLCRYKIPMKIPTRTVRARNITVLANYLEMSFKSIEISRYDINFSPDRPKKMLPIVFQQVKKRFYASDLIAFDQMKNCYSLRPLKNVTATERFTTTVDLLDQNGRNMTFEVTIKSTGVVDLGNIKRYMVERGSSLCHPTEEIQCIDVILRQGALESYVKAGRQFFKRPANPVDLGSGYEMWTGLFQSAIFTNKSFINIDVAHKGFPKAQSMIDCLVKDFNLDPYRPIDNQRGGDNFATFVKGLKVVASLVGNTATAGHKREFVCNGVVGPPDKLTFPITESDGRSRKLTVAEYFAKEKQYRLKYPHLNCLWVGSRERCIYFPMELLNVSYGQPLARQLNEMQVSKMVKEAATPPDERLAKIKEVISNMQYSQNKDFKQFGLEISDKFYTVQAKILDPPVLEVGNAKVTPRKGQWQANRLLKAEALQSWGLIAVDTDPRIDYDSMISLIISTGNQLGMNVSKPKFVNLGARMTSLHGILMNAYKDVRFVFVIVSARGRDDYHKVKQMAEREVGILTQCIREMTARRINQMTAKNILLKVNSKLMGVNQAIEHNTLPKCLRDGNVMIVGADVTHPSPDQSNVPSIAAVTASIDPRCYMYNIELSVQTPKKEMIVEFEDMMFDHLKVYKDRNNSLPKKIFVFRDGVSEGQFAQVMNSELQAVQQAYQRMAGQSRKPEILFLLVQKRHHTRLFCDGTSRYNVEPGTVVDTDIVHASELDFYLVPHQAIKGTARPTRYHAVCNDGKIPDDEVEQLTYYLCHLYSRCMRAVSYPTPTYYAHLACLRARSLTHGERFDNKELERHPKRLHVLDKMLQYSRMFFV